MEDENRVDNGESGRRRFIRRLTTLGAAGGIATLLYGRVTEKPLIQLAQAASGEYLSMDNVNTAAGTTELDSTVVGDPGATSGYGYGVFLGYDTATSGYAYGLMGVSDSTTGRGVRGWATAGSGETVGVHGRVDSPGGYAVVGYSSATSADPGMAPTGVSGEVMANGGSFEQGPWPMGVEGYAGGTSGLTMGVFGHTGYTGSPGSPDGTGVVGIAYATTGYATGIYGQSDSPDGMGVSGYASATSGVEPGNSPKGVYGEAYACGGSWDTGPWPRGVEGHAAGSSGVASGVYGQADSPDADGVTGIAWAPGGSTYGVYGESESTAGTGVGGRANADGGIGVLGRAGGAGAIPIIARAASGQTAPLQEWVNDNLTPLAVVDKDGKHGIGTSAPVSAVQVVRPVSWANADPLLRLDGDTYNVGAFFYAYGTGNFPFFSGRRSRGSQTSPSAVQANDLLMRYGGAGYGTNAFPSGNRAMLDFYAAENWTNTAQGTYVTISTTATGAGSPSEKVRVTGDGAILPPSDNTGSIGKVGQRWSLVRAQTITSGDLTFENGARVTEQEDGFAFVNPQGIKTAVLDAQGNFHIKGKFVEDL